MQTTKASRRGSQLFPTSLASSTATSTQVPAVSPYDRATFQDSFTPTTTSASYPFDSPSASERPPTQEHHPNLSSKLNPPPMDRTISGSALLPGSTSSTSSTRPPALAPALSTTLPTSAPSSSITPQARTGPSETDRTNAKDAAHSAAKSFRVTLDDPCFKVLPAALKKYRINDDWRLYALFICFGNTGE
jgi:hypothetical protein